MVPELLVIILIITSILTILFLSVNIIKRRKMLKDSDSKKLISAKRKYLVKTIIYKLFPIFLCLAIIIISSVVIYKSNFKEQSKDMIYRNGEPTYLVSNSDVLYNIKWQISNVIIISIIIWIILNIISYIFYINSINRDTNLNKEEAVILSKYYSGRMTYKILGSICILILLVIVFGYLIPAMEYII